MWQTSAETRSDTLAAAELTAGVRGGPTSKQEPSHAAAVGSERNVHLEELSRGEE